MRLLYLLLLLFQVTLPLAAEPVSACGGALTFTLPKEFTPLSAEEIGLKFPPIRPPQLAYGNASRSVTIAINHTDSKLRPGQLVEFGSFMKKAVGVRMTVTEDQIVNIGETRWIRLVGVAKAIDQPIHNEMLITSLQDRALMINLNSTVQDYPKYEKALEALKLSLKTSP